jgi:hypothetical protein
MAGLGSTAGEVAKLANSLDDISSDLKYFSSSMRSLSIETSQNTDLTDETCKSIVELQHHTRDDAKLFIKVILPLTTNFVSFIKNYFELYKALSFDDWCKNFQTFLEKAKLQKEFAQTLVMMYEDMTARIKRRQDKATVMKKGYRIKKDQYDAIAEESKASAKTKKYWKIGLAFVPGVNLIACPLLYKSQSKDMKRASEHEGKSKDQQVAADVVEEHLIPSLSSFIEGLKGAAGFFQIREEELKSLHGKKGMESFQREHYKLIRSNFDKMHRSFVRFYDVLPDIRTDVRALEDGDTQQNHIDEWLEKMLAEIKKIISADTQKAVFDVITRIPGLRLSPQSLLPSKHAIEQ